MWRLRWAWIWFDHVYCNTVIHLKSENNCCSVYMNKTFNGHTPKVNGLLNLDRSDTHVHAKRYKIVMIVPHTWHCYLSHIGIKTHEEAPCWWIFGLTCFLKRLRHANHVYWYICMKKLHTDGSFGLTWFWITWDMQIITHGQDDWKSSFSVRWNKKATCWK